MSMLENLAFIKDQGTDAFLQKEEEKWQCPYVARERFAGFRRCT
jgi:hypothetical protein